jgi:hypothetical protein
MCGLCGLFGGADHWTTAAARPQVFGGARTRRAERAQQVRLANRVLLPFALRLEDWQGTRFVLSSATGKRAMAETLPEVWTAAASMLGRPIDPLDPAVLARLGNPSDARDASW